MNCLDGVTIPFSTMITIPEGFLYSDKSQLSVAVSTSDLNIYVVEDSFITDELVNPCTSEPVPGITIYVKEIRMGGVMAFRVALNALVGSYNFMLGDNPLVNGEGWSSSDGFVQIKADDGGVLKDYIVIGYLDPENPDSMPTKDDIVVVLESYNVQKHTIGEETVLELKGTFSFKVQMP